MAGDIQVTVVGALTNAPELRWTNSGRAVASFSVASNARHYDRQQGAWVDDPPVFMRCSLWGDAAENATNSLDKGARVIVTGRLKQREFQTREGDKRTVMELDVDEIGPSLRWAEAKPVKVTRGTGGGGGDWNRQGGTPAPVDDPWQATADDPAPF